MLTIALPKGSLEEQTMLLFAQADLEVKKSSREYNPTISDPRIGKVKILRPHIRATHHPPPPGLPKTPIFGLRRRVIFIL